MYMHVASADPSEHTDKKRNGKITIKFRLGLVLNVIYRVPFVHICSLVNQQLGSLSVAILTGNME